MGLVRAVAGFLQAVACADVFHRADAGVDISLRDMASALQERTAARNALLAALDDGDAEGVARLLDERPTLVGLRDNRSFTVLMKASSISTADRSAQMVRLLLDAGAQATIGAIDSSSMTALMYAARRGHLDTVKLLLERPVSAASAATVRDASTEIDGLLDAIESGRLEQEIKAHGNPSAQVRKLAPDDAVKGVDAAGRTALMKASAIPDANKSLKATKLLLQVGSKAVINVIDYEGKSALAHAAGSGNFNTCQLLINHTGSLGPRAALLPPKDIFQVTELNTTGCPVPEICKGGKFFCFEPEQFDERFGELDVGSGETKFRAFANGRSGWIRVFKRYRTRGEDCGCASCGRWDNETLAAAWNWTIGDVIMRQAANYWPVGSRVRIAKGSPYSYQHKNEGTCATLTSNSYEGAGRRDIQFEDGLTLPYEFKDLEPCSEVMPFDVDSGECKTDPDHCVMSPSFPEKYSGLGGCGVRIRTPARLHPVAFRVGGGDRLEWQQEPPLKPTATLVWESAYNLFGVEPSKQKHNVSAREDFRPFQESVPIMPWLLWSPKHGGGGGQGWRICEALMDWRDANGETALMKAIDARSEKGLAVLAHLLERNANVEGGNKTGQTALMKACEQPNATLAQKAVGLLLTSSNAHRTLHAVDAKGRTALMHAVMQCSADVVKALLTHSDGDAGKLMGCVDDDGKGALLHAVENCNVGMVEVLANQTAAGFDAKVRWCKGGQKRKNNNGTAAGMHRDAANKTTIMYAAERPTVEILEYLVKLYGGFKLRVGGREVRIGSGELHIGGLHVPDFAFSGSVSPASSNAVDIELEYESFVNLRDNESRSALSYAAKHGHWGNIQFLKDHGANMTALSASNKTVLQYAVESGNSETVKNLWELLESSDSSDMKQLLEKMDDGNRTALMYAAGSSDNTTKILLEKRADISARDANGTSVLMYAAQGGNPSVVATILAHAHALLVDNRSSSPRVLSDAQGDTLVDMISWKDKRGATALMYASQVDPRDKARDAVEVIEKLLEAKADVALRDSCYFSPLMAAAQEGYFKTVRALLDACENDPKVMNARDGDFRITPLPRHCKSPLWGFPVVWGPWRTAAWLAAENGHVPVVKELILRKADVLLRDRWRMLPIEVAQNNSHIDVMGEIQLRVHPSMTEQVSRTLHFKDFWRCLAISVISSVAVVLVFICCQIGCRVCRRRSPGEASPPTTADSRSLEGQEPICTDRGAILLAARAVRFRTRSAGRRKVTYALNVCANVLMPFGPLMYFADPDIVVAWWLVFYFVLPVLCSALKASQDGSSALSGGKDAFVKLLQFPSLAMTGKYLIFPWISRWLRPRLLIFFVTFTELIMRIGGRRVSPPSAVLFFNPKAEFWPVTAVVVDTFHLYTAFLVIISIGAVLWRTGILPLFADIGTLCWVAFGTPVFARYNWGGWVSVVMALLLLSYLVCFYMAHVYFMAQKDHKVGRRWWKDEFDGYEEELIQAHSQGNHGQEDIHGDFREIMRLAREVEKYSKGSLDDGTELSETALTEKEKDLTEEGVKFWHLSWRLSWCDPDRPFSVPERVCLGVLSVIFDALTIFFLLLADRFVFAGIMLSVCIGSFLLHKLLWCHDRWGRSLENGDVETSLLGNGHCSPTQHSQTTWQDLIIKGVPTPAFLKSIDRTHGIQDFFSLCITLRSLPLIGKEPLVMVFQMVSVAMSTWGLTTFLFEKIELEITNLYYDSDWYRQKCALRR